MKSLKDIVLPALYTTPNSYYQGTMVWEFTSSTKNLIDNMHGSIISNIPFDCLWDELNEKF